MTNTLPQRLHNWRLAQAPSLERAAARLGVTSSTLFRWEHGLTRPRSANDKAALERELSATANNETKGNQ